MSTGFVPSSVSTVCVTSNLGQRSRGISVLAGERAQGFGLHASLSIGSLAVLLRQGAVHGSATRFQEIGRPPAVAALAGGADPDEVVRILGFSESFVRPASVERACADQ